MNDALTPNTQAILLLTAPLIVGRGGAGERLLVAAEYGRLATHLRGIGHAPADLLGAGAQELLHACKAVVDTDQVRRLLARGFLLSQAVERWSSRAIWVMSRADTAYPRRLKARMRESAPPVLYGCGDVRLLATGGLALVGSRRVNDALATYADGVGELVGSAQKTLVSAEATGVDRAAIRGASRASGSRIVVLADGLEKAALKRENRDALLAKRLLLVTLCDPSAGFKVAHALERDRLVYALADAALVVDCDVHESGIWAGLIEQLETLRYVRVYVRSTGARSAGIAALEAYGAEPWPNPSSAAELDATLRAAASSKKPDRA